MILYHGTNKKFNEFKPSIKGSFGRGIYLSPNYATAKMYGKYSYKVKTNLKNPLYINSNTDEILLKHVKNNEIEELQKLGYDGLIIGNENHISEVVVWDSTQLEIVNEPLKEELNDAFWKWFGKSKLIENGQPMLFYHRTNAVFDVFDKDFGSPLLADGFYFSSKPLSEWYGKNIMKVYLKMENPYIIEDMQNIDSVAKFVKDFNLLTKDIKTTLQNYSDDYRSDVNTAFDGKAALRRVVKWHLNDQTRYVTEKLQKKNYDGLIIKNSDGQGGIKYDEYIVFHPNQIKSIGNKGTWSITSDNIYESLNKELERYL